MEKRSGKRNGHPGESEKDLIAKLVHDATVRPIPPADGKVDIIDQIISEMPRAPNGVLVDAAALGKLVDALQEFVAVMAPALQKVGEDQTPLRLHPSRAGTRDWLRRVGENRHGH